MMDGSNVVEQQKLEDWLSGAPTEDNIEKIHLREHLTISVTFSFSFITTY